MTLSPPIRTFLDAPRFASIATLDPDGAPRQTVVWYLLEGDRLVLNSRAGRRWPANLMRDGRLAVSVIDPTDGYRWVGLTGVVEEAIDGGEAALADIAAMARRYHDPDEADRMIETFRSQHRISFRIRILEVHDHLE